MRRIHVFYVFLIPFLGFIFILPPTHAQDVAIPYIEDATIETVAGVRQLPGYTGDDVIATNTRLNQPRDVAFYRPNSFLIADTNNHRIRRVDRETGLIHAFAGNGVNSVTGNQGIAEEASIASPIGLAVDPNNNVFITSLYQIRIIYPSGVIDLFAGKRFGDKADEVIARDAEFSTLGGIDIDTNGTLYFADTGNNKIRMIQKQGADWVVSTFAGTGSPGSTGDGGHPLLAELNAPTDVAVSDSGDVFITEKFGSRVRWVRDGVIRTLYSSTFDIRFSRPLAVSTYKDWFVYFSGEDHIVRRVKYFDLNFNSLDVFSEDENIQFTSVNSILANTELVAGNGMGAFVGENALVSHSAVNYPSGLATDLEGDLYIADWYNFVVRRVHVPPFQMPPTPTPTPSPSPTSTPTLAPSATPTQTPRPRTTTTPTVTPVFTATPTATPTGLPQGQLAPVIASGISEEPGYVFFTNSTQVEIPSATQTGKVQVVISSSPDGKGEILTQDTITLAVQHPAGSISYATISFEELGTSHPPQDITNLFAKGRNTVSARLIDSKGAGYSSSSLYVVVYSAPMLRDIPDIRVLVDEEVNNLYELDDYIYDRDTPLEDIQWRFLVDPEGPEVLRGPRHGISVGAYHKPAEFVFSVSATDGIFSVTEDVHIKISSFMIDRFILPDAPLVEDFAYESPYSLRFMLDPPDVNIADVPFDASFEVSHGMKAVHVAKGTVYMFPEFPGGKVQEPLRISIKGERTTNPKDRDGVVVYSNSVYSPQDGVPEKNLNFTAESLGETEWDIIVPGEVSPGEISLDAIPPDPVDIITDGYGVNAIVDPGENIALLSKDIKVPTGPTTISMWFAVEKLNRDFSQLPTVTLALMENSSNLSYTTVRGKEILGNSRYQFLHTTYNVLGPKVQALIQVAGTQQSGRAEIYIDNLRIFSSAYEMDRALADTRLPMQFDGTFESVVQGLGVLFDVNESASYGSSTFIDRGTNRTVYPTGFDQSLILSLDEPESAIQVEVGPNPVDRSLFPRAISVRAHVQKVIDGGGYFALGLTNGYQEAVSFISNDRLPLDPHWHAVTTTGLFTYPEGVMEPMIILQNRNIPGAFPGIILDGATLAVDDISLNAFQDSPKLWDQKMIHTD